MGCTLCALRSKDEQYKLLYEVCQVGGKDSGKAAHGEEEAAVTEAALLRAARDPVVVEVLRRGRPSLAPPRPPGGRTRTDASTQTELPASPSGPRSPATPPLPNVHPLLLAQGLCELPSEYFDSSDYLPSMQQDAHHAEGLEYEEVDLHRGSSRERLGLTVCYRTEDEDDAGIYVSQVNPNSIAARDGRIREGDRILQINGLDVHDRRQAVARLTQEEGTDVSLLLARPDTQLEDGWVEEEHRAVMETLRVEILQDERMEPIAYIGSSLIQARALPDDDAGLTDSVSHGHGKDSGLGRTDESSEHDGGISVSAGGAPPSRAGPRGGSGVGSDLRRHLRTKAGTACGVADVRREIALLHDELRRFEMRVQSHGGTAAAAATAAVNVAATAAATAAATVSPHDVGAEPGLTNIAELPEGHDPDPASAAFATAASPQADGEAGGSSPPGGRDPRHGARGSNDAGATTRARPAASAGRCRPERAAAAAATTSADAGGAPVPLHARHYRSYMQLVQQKSAVEYAQSQLSLASLCQFERREAGAARPLPQSASAPASPYEWKVRACGGGAAGRGGPGGADGPGAEGSRCLTARRPVRDRLLRQRALRIREERSGVTTDDDVLSEMKTGRYWSKEQRKQQLVRAREQRRRREFMLRCRLDWLGEKVAPAADTAAAAAAATAAATAAAAGAGDGVPAAAPPSDFAGRARELSILELSHRKMMKKRNKKILDNWMTIQEMLAHGQKSPDGNGKVYNPLLSVTTV
ncbi:E3 ubiquitin-protein ligase PDZRN3-B-like [Lethenteron reissneri]|uniref:E3 ubiquitin-protein ligase PDZRN3-B-like n=1 Tax=Lethenteron reissneri TaxID=7753 RepID=UPI002AB6A476|nr:E3 ubiquitin-protein ligase PDZRN3-B-like [Lethenteron reissneri]